MGGLSNTTNLVNSIYVNDVGIVVNGGSAQYVGGSYSQIVFSNDEIYSNGKAGGYSAWFIPAK